MLNPELVIKTSNLSKDYKVVIRDPGLRGMMRSFIHPKSTIIHAVKNLNLEIIKGELVGYIGPNGSGKSTTIKMLSGILEPTSGDVQVAGLIPSKERIKNAHNIGVVFGQRTQLWWDLPVQETFELLRHLYDIPSSIYRDNIYEFTQLLELKDILNKPVRQLSLGQRMRAEFASALLHNPKILFLDEPTIGLDISIKRKVWDFIKKINRERQVTVILTSHDMQDIETLSSRLIVVDEGVQIFDGSIKELKSKYINKYRIRFKVNEEVSNITHIDGLSSSINICGKGNDLYLVCPNSYNSAQIVAAVMDKFEIRDINIENANIDDVVMEVFFNAQQSG